MYDIAAAVPCSDRFCNDKVEEGIQDMKRPEQGAHRVY